MIYSAIESRGLKGAPTLSNTLLDGQWRAGRLVMAAGPLLVVRGRVNRTREDLVAIVSMKQLLESGVHFGHRNRRWNPKMRS